LAFGYQSWCFFLGVLIAISSKWGGGLSQLQTKGLPITVFYWASLFYESFALPLTGVLILVILILIISLVIQVFRKKYQPFMVIAMVTFFSLLGIGIALSSIFPLIFVSYVHLDGTDFEGHRYNLGVKTPFDGDLVYIIGKCDRLGIRCDCYAVSPVESSSDWKISRLKQDDSTHTLSIVKGNQIVFDIPSKL
jgi:predicted ferric reductase